MEKEILNKIVEFTEKEISLSELSDLLDLNEYEVLGKIRELRLDGTNIVLQRRDDDIYLLNRGERELVENNSYKFETDENNEFKFIVISDTRIGSKSQQLSILNDIYIKGFEMGYNNVIHLEDIQS